ncbi:hypothetical protein [Ralstonia solanacearum]|uniref:hypothetical protein n=1 Tax=Ralstonia solanacearum TaxID=305 RepID=UPI001E5B33B3|nr:hypothetical protein [Ralstonia solanacearum]
MQQLSGCLMAIALAAFGCSSHAGETVLKEVEVTNRLGERVQIPNPSREDRLAATAPGYVTPADSRSECLGRLMFDLPTSTNVEWAAPSGASKYGPYERLSQYFDNGTGRGRIEIETPQLRTVFAVYGPVTPALLDAFLNYRAHMNEATLRGRLDSLKIQRERIEMFRQSPELLGPNGGERLAEELKKTEQDIADLKADRYQKVIDLGRPGSVAFRTNIKDSGECQDFRVQGEVEIHTDGRTNRSA